MTHNTDIFNHIKQQVSILDVVQEYVSLKQSGSYWKGYSPFRSERIPSFTVSPEKGIFYCFSTNIGGDVIHFISQMENCSQYEAAQHLMDRYQLHPPDDLEQTQHDDKKTYHLACSVFATWCHKQLLSSHQAHTYVSQRGFHDDVITRFQVGYCPARSTLMKRFLPFAKQQGISQDDLINAQILKQGTYGIYSPFEERIMFPIANHLGHICGFGGRTWKANDQRAKYYNSQDHPYFHKGKLVYNLDQAKHHIHNGYMYLVEGYTDCLAMAAAGYYNTVATLGTACGKDHLTLIARYARNVCILYDGDTAGQNALLRLTKLCWDVDLELSVIPLHEGEDPAILMMQNQLDDKLQSSYDIFQYYIARMGSSFLQKPLQERIQSARDVFQTIAKLQDPLKKDLLLQQAAQTFDIPFERLYKDIMSSSPQQRTHHDRTRKPSYLTEKCIIYAAMMHDLELSDEDISMIQYYLPQAVQNIFRTIIAYKKEHNTFNFNDFFAILHNEEQRIISKITAECESYTHTIEPDNLLQQFYKKKWKEVVNRVKSHAHDQQQPEYTQAIEDLYALKHHIVRRGLYGNQKAEQSKKGTEAR